MNNPLSKKFILFLSKFLSKYFKIHKITNFQNSPRVFYFKNFLKILFYEFLFKKLLLFYKYILFKNIFLENIFKMKKNKKN